MGLTATVVITTKNRRDELRTAIISSLKQTAQPEILVIDDASTDGTSEMVRAEFPSVRLVRSEESLGCIVQRNRAAHLTKGEIIFSIDDDAEFSSPHVVAHTLHDFSDPRIAAVAIPYIEPHKSNALLQNPPDSNHVWLTDDFIGTAHALRRDVFIDMGGYCEPFVHQGEESDLAIRLFEAGYVIRLGDSDPIFHYESPKRDFRKMDFLGSRNLILFQWRNAPSEVLYIALAATSFNCLRWTLNPRRFWLRLKGLIAGFRDAKHLIRQPVSLEKYQIWRRIKKKGPVPIESLARLTK